MCYCGTVEKDGFYQCCQDRITMNQESRYINGQMSKREMVEWDMARDPKAQERRKMELEAFERQVNKSHFEKGEKIKVAPAYMPEEFKKAWDELGGVQKLKVPANETPREELLQRDVGILFEENRRLREENKRLAKINETILEQNVNLFRANQKLFLHNQKLIEKRKNNANV
jgi:hypothetical protein